MKFVSVWTFLLPVDMKLIKEDKVRKDCSFEKDYIHGRYGTIPFIGNLLNNTVDGLEN